MPYSIHSEIQKKDHVWETRKDVREIIKKLCGTKQVGLVDGAACPDHVHMYVAIPPKLSVPGFMPCLKGKSALALSDRHPEYRTKWGGRNFRARGYYVSTAGKVNEETMRKYIQEQEKTTSWRMEGSKEPHPGGRLAKRVMRNPPPAELVLSPGGAGFTPHLKCGLVIIHSEKGKKRKRYKSRHCCLLEIRFETVKVHVE